MTALIPPLGTFCIIAAIAHIASIAIAIFHLQRNSFGVAPIGWNPPIRALRVTGLS
jgi:hypothetical protein